MNSFWRLFHTKSDPQTVDDPTSSDSGSLNPSASNAMFRPVDGGDIMDPTSDSGLLGSSKPGRKSGRHSDAQFAYDMSDIDAGSGQNSGTKAGTGANSEGSQEFNFSNFFGSFMTNFGQKRSGGNSNLPDNVNNESVDSGDDGSVDDDSDDSVDSSDDGSDDGSVDDGNDDDVDSGDDDSDSGPDDSGNDSGVSNQNYATSQYKGDGAAGNLQGFNRRPYSKNDEGIFGTFFDPNNATAAPNGGMNIHMQGNAGAEITAAQNATAYGSYTTTTKSMDVHGANQTGFFYGDGRKFEVDLFEPALQQGDVNTFTSGMWLDNVKVAETNVKASDLGFKSFHDQPMTYKMDFQPGNIKISALNSKGEWQTIVDHSDPRISDQLARDTNFKQMFSAWGVNGEYKGAPVDFQVLKTGYSAQGI